MISKNKATFVERHWYQSTTFLSILLWPLAIVFGVIVAIRRALYRWGIKKTIRFSVPVIVVGNITVGGTGKTPFVIWLVNFLKAHGLRPGIVSRGVGGKQQHLPQWVTIDADPQRVGDEAILLVLRTESPVVIGIDRAAAVKELLAKTDCNIVISDDGLQHYRLGRNIEIALIDGMRRFGNKKLLPAGPLREPLQRMQQVDLVVTHGEAGPGEHAMSLVGKHFLSVKDDKSVLAGSLIGKTVHAIAGIGNPQRFFLALRQLGLQLIEHRFPDHYLYQSHDLNFPDNLPIIMTEKDAVKCRSFVTDKYLYLPVTVEISAVFENELLNLLNRKER
jgi:tetraacyldisaccharide 4'-kinase